MAWYSGKGTTIKVATMSYLMSGSDPAPQKLGFRGTEGMVNCMCPVGASSLHVEDFGGTPQLKRHTFPRKSR